MVFSVVVFIWLPDSPMKARFLTHEEKLIAIERLRMNQQGIASGKWRWDHVWECLIDPKTWIWFSLLTAVSIPSGGITTFGPLIVRSFGFSSFQAILFNMSVSPRLAEAQMLTTQAFRCGPNHRHLRRSICCNALESQIAFPGSTMCATNCWFSYSAFSLS